MKSTYFAPPEIVSPHELTRQINLVRSVPMLETLLDHLPVAVMTLNDKRQLLYANRQLLDMLGTTTCESLHGRRPGDILSCVHASSPPHGCGTTEHCTTCGAVRAVQACLTRQKPVQEDCQIQLSHDEQIGALDLRVAARPLRRDGELFTTVTVVDISHEKRREALERIFFHDVLNTATALLGNAELTGLRATGEAREDADNLVHATHRLIEEIQIQRDLHYAEAGDLQICVASHSSQDILQALSQRFHPFHDVELAQLEFDSDGHQAILHTDARLVDRVLANMVKNAIEAEPSGGKVRVGVSGCGELVRFWVWNDTQISRASQLQIFRRSFSTKGVGRGLGTYSMKLIAENYLQGRVSFQSDRLEGTTFFLDLPVHYGTAMPEWSKPAKAAMPTYEERCN